jgi:hypothetical protein
MHRATHLACCHNSDQIQISSHIDINVNMHTYIRTYIHRATATHLACCHNSDQIQISSHIDINVNMHTYIHTYTVQLTSHAAITLTRFWSPCIFLTEYANAIVTASGKPSGTATTMIVMESMKKATCMYVCTCV